MKSSPFTLLCAAGFFSIFSSTISKSPVLPLFAAHLGADSSGVGFVASVSSFAGIIASIPAGMLSDKFGRKKLLMFSLFIFATAPFAYLFVAELWQLAVIRFYHGFATAIFVPVATAFVSDLFQRERGEKIGWFSASTLLGRFMAPIIGGFIIGAMTMNSDMGYKMVYLVCGAAGIAALFFLIKIPDIAGRECKQQPWSETTAAFKTVISDKDILITAMVEAAILFSYGTFETFLPLYSIEKGMSAYQIGIFLSAQVIALALTKPLMGKFSDRHGRKPQIFAGAVIGAVCIGIIPVFKSFVPLLMLSILFGLSLSMVTSATTAFIADMSSKKSRGSAMGVLGSIMDIGHTTGPLIAGIIAVYFGLAMSFQTASFVIVTAAGVFLFGVDRVEKGIPSI
jgi:MFS transporter, DHA1 family, multidrug resistance protein